jgi:hypothetical protein
MSKAFDPNKFRSKRTAEPPGDAPPRKRKRFKAQFVQVPMSWIETLRAARRPSTWLLATLILAEAHKRKYVGGEIVLSDEMTGGMPSSTRHDAAKDLAALGLVGLARGTPRQAPRVEILQPIIRDPGS